MSVAVRCLEFYESYFEMLYPLPKLDLLAIPDFEAGEDRRKQGRKVEKEGERGERKEGRER